MSCFFIISQKTEILSFEKSVESVIKMKYLWDKGIKKKDFPALENDIDTDILIIGGGMAGVLCAHKLSKLGVDYVLLEADRIGRGITLGTTAVLTAQHDTLYSEMVKKDGDKIAKSYLTANLNAVKKFQELSKEFPCDFEEKASMMYSLDDEQLMRDEVKCLNELGFNAEFTKDTPMKFPVAGAVKYPEMAQFHPLKFLYAITENLNIYEKSFVHSLEGTTAFTDKGKVRAKKVIIATHFPFKNSNGLYFMKLYQRRSYVIALKGAQDLGCTIEDYEQDGLYFRNYKDLLIIGGGGHRTGRKGGFEAVRAFTQKYYPEAKEVYAWANQDCVSLDGRGYIGNYSPAVPDIYVASGFNLWGMTSSMVASDILCDLVLGKSNEFAETFNPDRSMLTAQLFMNAGNSVIDFIKPTLKRCSHLGCALSWNEAECTWDCPCHGSRFDAEGNLINGPAMKGINLD